jgi:anti-anti-sigma factor
MSVTVSSTGGVTCARLSGEIDTYTAPDVRAAFEDLAVAPGQKVVVDLRDVTFLDSSGLGAVIGLYHQVGEHGGRLQLVCGDITLRLVRLMHLDQVIDVVDASEPSEPSEGSEPS